MGSTKRPSGREGADDDHNAEWPCELQSKAFVGSIGKSKEPLPEE
jgi:hypothetical protein